MPKLICDEKDIAEAIAAGDVSVCNTDRYNGYCSGKCVSQRKRDFKGGYWGGSGGRYFENFYITRLPSEIVTRANYQIGDYHVTQHAKIENIIEDEIEYKCISVSGSQYGSGYGVRGGSYDCVWFQTNWVPVDDITNQNPIAGLAVARVHLCDKISLQAPPNYECTLLASFLVKDTDGDQFYWNKKEYLCNYFHPGSETLNPKKTLVGPKHFVLYNRRVGSLDNIKYWDLDDPNPGLAKFLSWTNQEETMILNDGWKPVYIDAHRFPMAMFHQVTQLERYPDDYISEMRRSYRVGKINLPTADILGTELETKNRGGIGHGQYGPNTYFFATETVPPNSPTCEDEDTYIYIQDAACHNHRQAIIDEFTGGFTYYPSGYWTFPYAEDPEKTEYFYGFSYIFFRKSNYAATQSLYYENVSFSGPEAYPGDYFYTSQFSYTGKLSYPDPSLGVLTPVIDAVKNENIMDMTNVFYRIYQNIYDTGHTLSYTFPSGIILETGDPLYNDPFTGPFIFSLWPYTGQASNAVYDDSIESLDFFGIRWPASAKADYYIGYVGIPHFDGAEIYSEIFNIGPPITWEVTSTEMAYCQEVFNNVTVVFDRDKDNPYPADHWSWIQNRPYIHCYDAKKYAGQHEICPPKATYYDINGKESFVYTLCYDASLDPVHPYFKEYTPPTVCQWTAI